MTINHMCLILQYSLWSYILICLLLKIILDKRKQKTQLKKNKKIESIFDYRDEIPVNEKTKKFLMQSIKNDHLFEKICHCYCVNKNDYTDVRKEELEQQMTEFIHYKIDHLRDKDSQARCNLVKNIIICDIVSNKCEDFLENCKTRSELEDLWIRTRNK